MRARWAGQRAEINAESRMKKAHEQPRPLLSSTEFAIPHIRSISIGRNVPKVRCGVFRIRPLTSAGRRKWHPFPGPFRRVKITPRRLAPYKRSLVTDVSQNPLESVEKHRKICVTAVAGHDPLWQHKSLPRTLFSVAESLSAAASGAKGCRFESCREY